MMMMIGDPFPKEFDAIIKAIFKFLFRAFSHIYGAHYEQILHLQQEGHLNTLFAHFVIFTREFQLLDEKELDPLKPLILGMESQNVIPPQ